jgi:hypothetical protein
LYSRSGAADAKDDAVTVAAGKIRELQFLARGGLAISVVWNQHLGDGGPKQRQLEPTDELVASG